MTIANHLNRLVYNRMIIFSPRIIISIEHTLHIQSLIKFMKKLAIFLLSASSLLSVCLFWENNLLLLILLLLIGILMLSINRSKTKLIVFLFCGFYGTIAEALAIYYGAWQYNNDSFLNVPFWLPVLWGIAAISILETANFIKLESKR